MPNHQKKPKEDEVALGQRLQALFDQQAWSQARTLLQGWLRREPESHWLLTAIAHAHYQNRQYQEAIEYNMKALRLAPHCPLVLKRYAATLYMLDRELEAICIYRRLLRRGVDSIAFGKCGEGLRSASSLLNDCRYRLALCYERQGKTRLAMRWLKLHLANRAAGVPTLRSRKEVKARLKKLNHQVMQ